MMFFVGLGLGLELVLLIGLMLVLYGYFFILNYLLDIVIVNFDNIGIIKIGKWYFNYFFMVVGLIFVILVCCVGFVFSKIIIG